THIVAALEATPADAPTAPRATATPTPEPSPLPTATRVIQLPTSRPTPSPGPTSAFAGAIRQAWDKSQTATAYRMEFDMSAKGNLGNLPGLTSSNQELVLFSMSGAVNGKDTQMVFKGWLSMFLGGDANQGFEMMRVGDKNYVRGPAAMFGAPENKWYVANDQFKSNLTDSRNPLNSKQPVDWDGFQKSGNETLDGKRCDIFRADRDTTYRFFQDLDTQGTQTQDLFDTLDDAEIKLWLCDDGYFHQLTMNLVGYQRAQPTDKVSMQVRIRLYDFGANIKITPPANPAPMQMPFFGLTTPTPTTKPK
ncbi:MAG: hypothetical protein AB1817_17460, partial [Chloroflexota bacterium]